MKSFFRWTPGRLVLCAGFCAGFALGLAPATAMGQTLTLGAALDSALKTHPSLGAAHARVDAAAAGRASAKAAYLPSILGTTGVTQFAEPMVVAPIHSFDIQHAPTFDETLIQSQLIVQYTLFDGGARRAVSRGARSSEEAFEFSRDATAQDLLQAVTATYTAVLASRELQRAANRQVEALASEHDRAQQRLTEGTAARVEVLRAEAALLDAQAQVATADGAVHVIERNLARLMGTDPAGMAGRPLADVAPSPDHAAGAVEETNPRVQAAERAVEASLARLDQQRAGRLPSVSAGAGLLNFGSSQGEYVTEWQAGIQLSWPVFTGGARRAAIRRAEADLRVAQEDAAGARLAAASDLDAADAAWLEASARAAALAASVSQWEEVARVEALSLENGAGVQQDFLRAQAALFHARAGSARAEFDMILALVGRARAQGILDRGWMDTALETAR